MRTVFVVERVPGNAYTTFTSVNGEQVRVPIRDRRIGPFSSIPEATDWLREKAMPLASYEIETEVGPSG